MTKYKAVPKVATDAMEQAAFEAAGSPSCWWGFADQWAAALAVAPSPWISVEDRLPDVPEGDHAELIVCVRRGHNGKVYVFAARYLNKYPLYSEHHEDADEDGMLLSTGWYDVKQHYEYDEWYSELIDPSSGDAVTHWIPLPEAPEVVE